MPKTALADTLMEWDSMLAALDQPEVAGQPHLRQLREELQSLIDATRAMANEQTSLEARRRALTQQLRITRGHGQDLMVKIRSAVRAQLGHRNEGLVRFRVRPVRRRSRAAIREEIGIATTADLPPSPSES